MSHDKLTIVVRADLSVAQQAVQAIHAACQFALENLEESTRWNAQSNVVALLAIENESKLSQLLHHARDKGIPSSEFREPDLQNSLTAIALGADKNVRKLCQSLKLALRE